MGGNYRPAVITAQSVKMHLLSVHLCGSDSLNLNISSQFKLLPGALAAAVFKVRCQKLRKGGNFRPFTNVR